MQPQQAQHRRAADDQPGVSAQIRRLERELGQDLLGRAARTVSLTEAGAAALPYARAALATKTTITLGGLADRALISLPRGTGLRSCLEDACVAAGFRPQIAFEAGDPIVLAQLAAHGLGVAIVPQPVADAQRKQVHTIAITRPALHGQIALAWRTEGSISPATQAFFITAANEVWA